MDGGTQLLVNGILYAAGVGVIGAYIKGVKNDIGQRFDRQFKICNGRMGRLEDSINHHGHKGLDEENSKVVRS